MKNEWSDNIWMIVALSIVLLVVWSLLTTLYVYTKNLLAPKGFDIEDVYSMQSFFYDEESPEYVEVEDRNHANAEDLRQLVRNLRSNPNVAAVAIHVNADPYNWNNYGGSLSKADGSDSINYYVNTRRASPDIIKVLNIKSLNNLTQDEMVAALGRGELLISPNPGYESYQRDYSDLIGERMIFNDDSTKFYRVGGSIENIRRNDYEVPYTGTVIVPFDERTDVWGNVLVRVKPGRGKKFLEDLSSNPELLNRRNVFLTEVMGMDEVREISQRSQDMRVRCLVAMILLVILVIFFGLLGTFWFRVQQRKGEIAIRKVCGATKRMVFSRTISEGWLLLLAATLFTSACVWPFVEIIESKYYQKWDVLLVMEIVSVVVLAAGIALSLWYPARKAMQIEPAVAIKDE